MAHDHIRGIETPDGGCQYELTTLPRAQLGSLFQELVQRRAAPSSRDWLQQAWDAAGRQSGVDAFTELFVVVARRVGKTALTLSSDEAGQLAGLGLTWPVGGWLDELARAALLLLAAQRQPPEQLAAIVHECYRGGENRERQAVLRTLPLLPEPERFVAIGIDACRTSIQPLFEAIACENPYPAAHFADHNFNQMVLKAMFIGVALERVIGLPRRRTPELTQMANDYASERRAAGRSVPSDIWRATGEQERET